MPISFITRAEIQLAGTSADLVKPASRGGKSSRWQLPGTQVLLCLPAPPLVSITYHHPFVIIARNVLSPTSLALFIAPLSVMLCNSAVSSMCFQAVVLASTLLNFTKYGRAAWQPRTTGRVSRSLPLLPAVQHQGSTGCAGSACTALLAAGVLCIERVLSLSVSQRALCDPHGGVKLCRCTEERRCWCRETSGTGVASPTVTKTRLGEGTMDSEPLIAPCHRGARAAVTPALAAAAKLPGALLPSCHACPVCSLTSPVHAAPFGSCISSNQAVEPVVLTRAGQTHSMMAKGSPVCSCCSYCTLRASRDFGPASFVHSKWPEDPVHSVRRWPYDRVMGCLQAARLSWLREQSWYSSSRNPLSSRKAAVGPGTLCPCQRVAAIASFPLVFLERARTMLTRSEGKPLMCKPQGFQLRRAAAPHCRPAPVGVLCSTPCGGEVADEPVSLVWSLFVMAQGAPRERELAGGAAGWVPEIGAIHHTGALMPHAVIAAIKDHGTISLRVAPSCLSIAGVASILGSCASRVSHAVGLTVRSSILNPDKHAVGNIKDSDL
ncbi:hypothetical protein Anapl_13246 [Anas platyrhynchos]|uniref:Uncharacterized protein n=1 Tax=Anas platyrhynchos TaxID=8839 RepID=R0K8Q2_ANAPL|nr:hypothetical protein Anapl_13246 [Anas platyrhynchos]